MLVFRGDHRLVRQGTTSVTSPLSERRRKDQNIQLFQPERVHRRIHIDIAYRTAIWLENSQQQAAA